MGIMDSLMGSGKQQLTDFVQRVEKGESVTPEESLGVYGRVAGELKPDQYRSVTEEVLARLNPQQRQELLQHLQSQAQQRDVKLPGVAAPTPEPAAMAGYISKIHEQPGLLRQLLGGAGTGASPAAAASAASPVSNPFQSPIAKMALAGIAAMGLKRLMNRR